MQGNKRWKIITSEAFYSILLCPVFLRCLSLLTSGRWKSSPMLSSHTPGPGSMSSHVSLVTPHGLWWGSLHHKNQQMSQIRAWFIVFVSAEAYKDVKENVYNADEAQKCVVCISVNPIKQHKKLRAYSFSVQNPWSKFTHVMKNPRRPASVVIIYHLSGLVMQVSPTVM